LIGLEILRVTCEDIISKKNDIPYQKNEILLKQLIKSTETYLGKKNNIKQAFISGLLKHMESLNKESEYKLFESNESVVEILQNCFEITKTILSNIFYQTTNMESINYDFIETILSFVKYNFLKESILDCFNEILTLNFIKNQKAFIEISKFLFSVLENYKSENDMEL
jgi:hypothetical protein